jgi:hypothetical protein
MTLNTFKNGNPPVAAARVTSAYSTILPSSNSSLSRCILAFIRALLDNKYHHKKASSNSWILPPSAHNFHVGSNLPDSILTHQIDAIPPNSIPSSTQKISTVYQIIFLWDLLNSTFPGLTFTWKHPWDSHWNQLFAKFILKHWRNAYAAGAFSQFFMDPVEAENTSFQLGLLHRWFMGRQKGVQSVQFSPEKKAKKSKFKIRKQVYNPRLPSHTSPTLD